MRRLITYLAVLTALLAAAPAGARTRIVDTNPVAVALKRAYAYWGNTPCHGAITVLVAAPIETDASMWTTMVATPLEETQLLTCPIYVSSNLWPNWYLDDFNFELFCKAIIHEVGHFEGHPDAGAKLGTIESSSPEFAKVPLCEHYRLVYGHHTFTPRREEAWERAG